MRQKTLLVLPSETGFLVTSARSAMYALSGNSTTEPSRNKRTLQVQQLLKATEVEATDGVAQVRSRGTVLVRGAVT